MADNVIFSPLRGVKTLIQDAASTDEAPGQVLAIPANYKNHTLYIVGSAGVASGAVQPESAETFDYSGTWAQIGGGPVTVVASTELIIQFEGVFNFIRCRISTAIGSGTVSVYYMGY